MGRTYADVNPPAPAHWETSAYEYSETIPHAVTSVTRGEEEDTYEYDANGNMTCRVEDDVTFIQTYNAENRISTVQKLASGDCAEPGDLSAHWAFAYDGDGVRTATLYTPYVDGDPQTPVLTTYYFGGLYEVTGESIRKYYALAGQTVAMDDGDGLKYFLTDHLGSTLAVLDDTGAVLEQQRYLPFGAPRELVGYSSIGLTDYTYTFQRSLPDMGLMDYRARFYSAKLGRFIQPDTIVPNMRYPQALNRYSYVLNRPASLIDPSGHICVGEPEECLNEKGKQINGASRRVGGRIKGEAHSNIVSILDTYASSIAACGNRSQCMGWIKNSMMPGFSDWEIRMLWNLVHAGPEGEHAAQYLYNNNIDFDNLTTQPFGTGAGWNYDGTISFPDSAPLPSADDAFTIGAVAHEAMHLEQGRLVALTAYGELQAWQIGIRVSKRFGYSYGPYGDQIDQLSLTKDPTILTTAVIAMEAQQNGPKLFGKNYLLGWLLLFTIPFTPP